MATYVRLKVAIGGVIALLAGLAGYTGRAADVASTRLIHAPPVAHTATELQVLTYNIHGLPWLIVGPRATQLAAIGQRLAALHRLGRAPQVAVIQEAFTADARAIARESGYRHFVYGPGEDGSFAATTAPSVQLASLERGDHWWKGEGVGKWEGSGLILLSDYPITRVHRLSYASQACAGYDCLAAKGALLARLTLPGERAVDIATTHLNSRTASGVDFHRANRAWLAQIEQLRGFIAAHRDREIPLIVAGDLNVGRDVVRQRGMADFEGSLGRSTSDGLRDLARGGIALPRDAAVEMDHAKDWELAVTGPHLRLSPQSAWVPFGPAQHTQLSDHYGYVVRYVLRDVVGGMVPDAVHRTATPR